VREKEQATAAPVRAPPRVACRAVAEQRRDGEGLARPALGTRGRNVVGRVVRRRRSWAARPRLLLVGADGLGTAGPGHPRGQVVREALVLQSGAEFRRVAQDGLVEDFRVVAARELGEHEFRARRSRVGLCVGAHGLGREEVRDDGGGQGARRGARGAVLRREALGRVASPRGDSAAFELFHVVLARPHGVMVQVDRPRAAGVLRARPGRGQRRGALAQKPSGALGRVERAALGVATGLDDVVRALPHDAPRPREDLCADGRRELVAAGEPRVAAAIVGAPALTVRLYSQERVRP